MTESITSAVNPILVAIDFSEDSRAALVWACKFAEYTDAPLVVLHVVHDLASQPGFYLTKKTDPLQTMQDVAETMMNDFLSQLKAEYPEPGPLHTAAVRLVPGLPPTRIIEVAGLLKADLISIGGRGVDCPPNSKLGSVAERVVELSRIPVVVVKSEKHGVLSKKQLKRLEKRQKKDRKRLKGLLGLTAKDRDQEEGDG